MAVSRRSLLRGLSLTSLMSALPSSVKAAPKRIPGPYEQLGIRPVVNFQGTMTTLGASKMWEELHEAAAQASREYVVLEELQEKIGKRLSALIGCEDAMVTTGAAAAISLGTCASLTGSDTQKVRQLPDLTGMKKEVVIQKVHRNGYDHAVRNTGVRIVDVESERALIDALGNQTAMMYFLGGTSGDWRWETPVSLERCREITRRAGVPLMVDAANMLPPWDNVRRQAGDLAIQFRNAHGVKQPATLHEDELEYQEGWKERRARLEKQFEVKPALTFTNGANGHDNGHSAPEPTASAVAHGAARPEEVD